MRNLLIQSLVGSGLLLGGLTASAQYQPPPQSRYGYESNDQVLNRVRSDLDRAEDRSIPFTADRGRLTAAREQISAFQRRLDEGNYDGRELDNAINSIRRVVDLNRMSDRTRENLTDDLARMRQMRDRLERDYR